MQSIKVIFDSELKQKSTPSKNILMDIEQQI